MKYAITTFGHPVLRKKATEVKKITPEIKQLAESLLETMYAAEGFGLAAEQIGFALYFHNFSTFLGQAGLYLEDLYVLPAYRGHGFGKAIFTQLAKIAVERGCGRLEWWCLDWNQPSIDFYLSLGAQAMDEWTVYRITGKTLLEMASNAVK